MTNSFPIGYHLVGNGLAVISYADRSFTLEAFPIAQCLEYCIENGCTDPRVTGEDRTRAMSDVRRLPTIWAELSRNGDLSIRDNHGLFFLAIPSRQEHNFSRYEPAVGRCATCRYGDPDVLSDGSLGVACGLSHFEDSPGGQRAKVWPIKKITDFCSDHEPKESTE